MSSILKAKVVGLYSLKKDGNTNSARTPFKVATGSSLANSVTNLTTSGVTNGDYALLARDNMPYVWNYTDANSIDYPAFIQVSDSTTNPITYDQALDDLTLFLAATNTSLDMSNANTEVVATDGDGGSETYIIGGAQSWSIQADGFMTTNDFKIADTFIASAINSYVIVRMVMDVTGTLNQEYWGQGIIESLSLSGGFDDNVTYSVSVQGYGRILTYE